MNSIELADNMVYVFLCELKNKIYWYFLHVKREEAAANKIATTAAKVVLSTTATIAPWVKAQQDLLEKIDRDTTLQVRLILHLLTSLILWYCVNDENEEKGHD